MSRTLGFVVASIAFLGTVTTADAQFGFALDSLGASPGIRTGGFGYSGYGYSAQGARGPGYYVGLPDYTANNGPSGYYSPIFNAMAAAPRDSVQLGPTYGGYAASSAIAARRQAQWFGSRSAGGTPYGPAAPPGYTYSSSYGGGRGHMPSRTLPPAPGFTYGYGQPPDPPRGFLGRIFGRN